MIHFAELNHGPDALPLDCVHDAHAATPSRMSEGNVEAMSAIAASVSAGEADGRPAAADSPGPSKVLPSNPEGRRAPVWHQASMRSWNHRRALCGNRAHVLLGLEACVPTQVFMAVHAPEVHQ